MTAISEGVAWLPWPTGNCCRRQGADAPQVPPVHQPAGEAGAAAAIAVRGVDLRERRLDGGDIAAVAVEEQDAGEAVVGQRAHPVVDRRHEGRGSQGDGAGEVQVMLGHADVEGRRDQDVGGLLRLVGDDLRAQPVGAEQAGGPVLLVRADRDDDGGRALRGRPRSPARWKGAAAWAGILCGWGGCDLSGIARSSARGKMRSAVLLALGLVLLAGARRGQDEPARWAAEAARVDHHPRRLGHRPRPRQDRRRRGVRHDLRPGRGRLQPRRDRTTSPRSAAPPRRRARRRSGTICARGCSSIPRT